GEGDNAPFGRRVGAAGRGAEAAAGDRRQVDNLAALAPLHQRYHGVAEQERAVQVELDKLLPVVEAQFIDGGARLLDDRAASDGVHQDVHRAVLLRGPGGNVVDLAFIERVRRTADRAATRHVH